LLRRHHRLREGLGQRLGKPFPAGPFDIWIQAASAGEAYLAGQLLASLEAHRAYDILVTANTRQGKDIIDAARARLPAETARGRCVSSYFPFDRPALMKSAVASIRPRIMVLLETEIWPGLINALQTAGIPVVIINGRLQAKSLRHYRLWPGFWHALAPERVLAVSLEDARRFACLYGSRRVSVMPNMKFDRIRTDRTSDESNPVRALLPPGCPLLVLGSVRREEEDAITRMVHRLKAHRPDLLIGLFPRHMHRIAAWQARLAKADLNGQLRSRMTRAATPGTIILWDTFGELAHAYSAAAGAFVGGTLAPLGGQNFLEPLTCGLIPVIGPSWHTFQWVGRDLFEKGLVRVAQDWQSAADALLELLENTAPKAKVLNLLECYLADRRGGTSVATAAIEQFLSGPQPVHEAPIMH
ncbi:MAG: glycosyltransferase N-terminal domain-containing protein, partial [Desulfobacterales bacterium]